jgi:hypothetical protein
MKPSIPQTRYFKPSARKLAMAFAFASLIGSLFISPEVAARDNGHSQARNRGHQAHGHGPVYRRGYGYGRPVYAPPAVYEEPRQSPGISLFLPLNLR